MKSKTSHQSNENFTLQTQFSFVCSIIGRFQIFHDKIFFHKERRNDKIMEKCEGWDSGPQVRFANSKFLLNFEMKTDLKLFVTQHKYKFA